ncbi:alcohol dehydrogenase [acceptor]-like [Tubulanus polymorphus]|uniref:alcohol dehydrogenase [acceptor]-like n=1 Tax=Tubulanus polymorphus TaxID=672921 RepID=UPI003DA4CF40
MISNFVIFAVFTGVIIAIFCRPKPSEDIKYDIIIVGAGTSGTVLANRLSENNTLNIALIEAGDVPSGWTGLLSSIPIATPLLQKSSIDWSYISTPQKYACRSLKNKQFTIPAGKAVGGTSTINAMLYVRGNRADYNNWEQTYGASGWNYSNLLKYFIKSENNKGRLKLLDPGFHGFDGPLQVSDVDTLDELTEAFLKAGTEAGFPLTDVNGRSQIGFTSAQATTYRGMRWSTYDAYMKPALNRENLKLLSSTHVDKVLVRLSGDSKQIATGVQLSDGRKLFVKPGGEVLLSAGAIATSKIMMLSGIGPRKHLESHNIESISDLPVGHNLQDHPFVGIYFSIGKTVSITESKLKSLRQIVKYVFQGKGYLSGASGFNGIGFIKTKYQTAETDIPDIELQSIGVGSIANDAVKTLSNYKEDAWAKFIPPNHDTDQEGFIIAVTLVSGIASRGTIKLQSNLPEDDVLIDPNILSSGHDVNRLVEGIKMTIDIINSSKAFQAMDVKPHLPVYEGCEHTQTASDEYFACLVTNIATTVYHSCGTCRMGDHRRNDTVVDPKLRVKGIRGLRIVDASIMPQIPTGNLNAPIVAMAERASDIVKSDLYK